MTKAEIKKLDKLWAVRIKYDVNYECELTGENRAMCQLHSHHFIGRRYRSLRWWLPNGVCLSASKHIMSIWSAHENPEWFRKQMLDLRGKKWLNSLNKRSNLIFKGTFQQVKDYLDGKTEDYL